VNGVVEESMRLWASLSADELMALKGPPLPSQVGMGPVPGAEPGAPSPGGGPGPAQEKGAKREESLPKPPPDPINNQSQGTESLGLPAQPLPQA